MLKPYKEKQASSLPGKKKVLVKYKIGFAENNLKRFVALKTKKTKTKQNQNKQTSTDTRSRPSGGYKEIARVINLLTPHRRGKTIPLR